MNFDYWTKSNEQSITTNSFFFVYLQRNNKNKWQIVRIIVWPSFTRQYVNNVEIQ